MGTLTTWILVCVLGLPTTAPTSAPADKASAHEESIARFVLNPFAMNVFAWWRPEHVIDPEKRVPAIAARIAGLSTSDIGARDLRELLGEDSDSAFIFPAAVEAGAPGRAVLAKMLSRYESGGQIDDHWLLAIAALGRISSPESAQLLRTELRRVVNEYDLTYASLDRVVLDALLSCEAGRGVLTPKLLDELDRESPVSADAGWVWWMGLAWANEFMPPDKVVDLIFAGLRGCSTQDLNARLEMHVRDNRKLDAIQHFLGPPKSVWPIFRRAAVLRSAELDAVRADWIRTRYLTVVMYYETFLNREGTYTLDDDTLRAFLDNPVKASRALALGCAILRGCCQPSASLPRWEEFLTTHAAELHPEDVGLLEQIISRSKENAPKLYRIVQQDKRPAPRGQTPGVHIMGLKRSPGGDPRRKP